MKVASELPLLFGVSFGLCVVVVRILWRGEGWLSLVVAMILWCVAVAIGFHAVRVL